MAEKRKKRRGRSRVHPLHHTKYASLTLALSFAPPSSPAEHKSPVRHAMPDYTNIKSKIEAPRPPAQKRQAAAVRLPIGVVRRAKTQVGMPLDDRLQSLAEQRAEAAERRKALLKSYTEAARQQLKKCKMRPRAEAGEAEGGALPLFRAGGRDGMHLQPMDTSPEKGGAGARVPLSPDLRRQRKALPKVGGSAAPSGADASSAGLVATDAPAAATPPEAAHGAEIRKEEVEVEEEEEAEDESGAVDEAAEEASARSPPAPEGADAADAAAEEAAAPAAVAD